MSKVNFFANAPETEANAGENSGAASANATVAASVNMTSPATSSFAEKLAAQLLKQTSKTEVIDKKIIIKDISPVVTKDGEIQDNRRRIIDTNGVTHWCFTNQLSSEKLAAGMPCTISYREKKVGDQVYINVLKVTAQLELLNAQQLAYLNNNPLVIPVL